MSGVGASMVNARIEVLWRSPNGKDGTWYAATVSAYDPDQEPLCHLLSYDDGEREWVDLESLEWRNLGRTPYSKNGFGFSAADTMSDTMGDNTLDGIPEVEGESTELLSSSSVSSMASPRKLDNNSSSGGNKNENNNTASMLMNAVQAGMEAAGGQEEATVDSDSSNDLSDLNASVASLAATRMESAKMMLEQLEVTAAALRAKSMSFQHQKRTSEEFLENARKELQEKSESRLREAEALLTKRASVHVNRIKRMMSKLKAENGSVKVLASEKNELQERNSDLKAKLKAARKTIQGLKTKLKRSETENMHLRKKVDVVKWRQEQAAAEEQELVAAKAEEALKAVKKEQNRLRKMRQEHRSAVRRQEERARQQLDQKQQWSNSTNVNYQGLNRAGSESDEDKDDIVGDFEELMAKDAGTKASRSKGKAGAWSQKGRKGRNWAFDNRSQLVQLVYSLISAVDAKKLKHGTKALPGLACLLQMSSSSPHDGVGGANGNTSRLELLRLSWNVINVSLTLPGLSLEGRPGFGTTSKTSRMHGGSRVGKGSTHVPGPDCQRLLQAIFGIGTTDHRSIKDVDKAGNIDREDSDAMLRLKGAAGDAPSFLKDPTLVNPVTSPLLFPDSEVVVISALIVLRCICRVEFNGAALEALALALRSNEGKRIFIDCHGIRAIIPMLGSVSIRRRGHPRILGSMVAVLLSAVRDGPHLTSFLRSCVTPQFFTACARAFRMDVAGNMHNQIMKLPDLQVIEALSMILERLSRSRSTHKLFVKAGLIPKLKEWSRVLRTEAGEGANFLVMNANAIISRINARSHHRGANGSSRGPSDSFRAHASYVNGGDDLDAKEAARAVATRRAERRDREHQQRRGSPSRYLEPDHDSALIKLRGDDDKVGTALSQASSSPIRMSTSEVTKDTELTREEIRQIEQSLYDEGLQAIKDNAPRITSADGSDHYPRSHSSPRNLQRDHPLTEDMKPIQSPSRHSSAPTSQISQQSGYRMEVPEMVDAVAQSPERSTDDLLAFYNKLISKARALHEDEDSGPSEDEYDF